MSVPKKAISDRRFAWFLHLGTCYKRGYEAQKAGEPFKPSPYRNGSGVQQQRRGAWERGYKRAESGLPLDDTNG